MTDNAPNRIKEVNIRKVFYEKNPTLARFIPGIIYRYLKRIVHEDDVNDFLRKHGDKTGVDFARAGIEEHGVTVEVIGEENIPKEGRFIFTSNHPLGGFDGLIILSTIEKHFKNLKFLVNDILMNLVNLQSVFIPINKHGALAVESAREIEQAYESDTQILTFPAGLVSRKIKGQIVDLQWQKNFIIKSVKYNRDIIPIHISGQCSSFFYNLGKIRKFLGIKSNIEMLYLVNETYKHQNKHFTLTIGKPISWQTFTADKKPLEWAKWVKKQAYKLSGIEKIPL